MPLKKLIRKMLLLYHSKIELKTNFIYATQKMDLRSKYYYATKKLI